MPDLRRLRVVGAGQPAPNIGLMRPVATEPSDNRFTSGSVNPDGPADHPIRQVVAARHIRVGENEHIAGLHAPAKAAEQRPHRKSAPTGVDRDAVGVGYQGAIGRGNVATEVVRLAEDRATRGAGHHPAHVPADLIQAILHQGQDNGVEGNRDAVWRRRLGLRVRCSGQIDVNEKIAIFIDPQFVSRADKDSCGAFFNQRRTGEPVAGPNLSAVVDRRVLPPLHTMPNRAGLHRRRLIGGTCSPRDRNFTSETTGGETKRRHHDRAIRLHVAVQSVVFGLECGPHCCRVHLSIRHRHPNGP